MNRHLFTRMFLGLIIVAAGVLFLLRQLGYINFDFSDIFSTFWPVILILVGIKGLSGGRGNWWAFIPLGLGVYFLGRNLDFFHVSLGEIIPYAIPIGLILFGISMIFRPNRSRRRSRDDDWHAFSSDSPIPPAPPLHPDPTQTVPPPPGTEAEQQPKDRHSHRKSRRHSGRDHGRVEWWNWDPDVQTRSGFIGDIHLGQDYWELKPMNISHFIGDTVLDLTKAQIPYGETRITISSFIGDVKVFLPNDYEVGVQVISSAFIGDSTILDRKESGLFRNSNVETPSYQECEKKIHLVVSTFIGDVRVTKVG